MVATSVKSSDLLQKEHSWFYGKHPTFPEGLNCFTFHFTAEPMPVQMWPKGTSTTRKKNKKPNLQAHMILLLCYLIFS